MPDHTTSDRTMPDPRLIRSRVARRQFLQFGAFGFLGAAVNCGLLRRAAATTTARAPIKACILVAHYGGPSHIDTWDMKPDGPAEIRGEYKPIATNVPGRIVCEHLPRMSQLVDKVALIRSMHHPMTNHNAAMYEALVGRLPIGGDNEILPANRTTDFPSYGATLTYLTQQGKLSPGPLPLTHVALPHVLHNVVDLAGQNAGFLGGRYDPLQLLSDPNAANFRVDTLSLPDDVPVKRLMGRKDLLGQLDAAANFRDREMQSYRQRAFTLLLDQHVQRAFDIAKEPESLRDRYGRNKFGQSMLLARRLVEAGVPFVNVNDKRINGQDANWDSHTTLFPRHKELLPSMDRGLSALIEDLDQRGLLESTLVVSMGEFGRSPKINSNAGRDHWPFCYSVVLSGGGVSGGATYGASDSIGAYPSEHPVTPGDLAATLFWRFGIDLQQEIHDQFGRPYRLAAGQPIRSLFPGSSS